MPKNASATIKNWDNILSEIITDYLGKANKVLFSDSDMSIEKQLGLCVMSWNLSRYSKNIRESILIRLIHDATSQEFHEIVHDSEAFSIIRFLTNMMSKGHRKIHRSIEAFGIVNENNQPVVKVKSSTEKMDLSFLAASTETGQIDQ